MDNYVYLFLFLFLTGILIFTISIITKKDGGGTPDGGGGTPDGGGGTPDGGGGTPDQNCGDDNCKEWLQLHNNYRQQSNYPSLRWDSGLASQAREYATKMNNLPSTQFAHGDMCNNSCTGSETKCPEGGRKCGQNLQWAPDQSTPELAVNHWSSECRNYTSVPTPNNIPPNPDSWGHYTQLMWKDTKRVGCASVGHVSNCLYDIGNVLGEFDSNVPPPGSCSQNVGQSRNFDFGYLTGEGTFDVV